MKQIGQNGHVKFNASAEFGAARWQIEDILSTLNPNHPNTISAIMDVVGWYGGEIDKAWSAEYSKHTLKDAQQANSTMLSAMLAGIQVGKDSDGHDQ